MMALGLIILSLVHAFKCAHAPPTRLQDGVGQLLERCETSTHVRSNDSEFRSNIAYHLSSVLRKEFHAERAEKL